MLVLLSSAACTFERRAEPSADETAAPNVGIPGEESDAAAEADALGRARSVVEQFREAVTVGDLSLALVLLHPDATLVDAEAGRAEEASSRGEFLLELRARHMTGMHFQAIETETIPAGAGHALVFTLMAMLEEGDDGIGEEVGRVFETAFLVDEEEGWRIRHLHRSVAPEP